MRNAEFGASSLDRHFRKGLQYLEGDGTPQNFTEAFRWIDWAAQGGHQEAQFILGTLYRDGKGVTADKVEAHMWFNVAATAGLDQARQARDELAEVLTADELSSAQQKATQWWDENAIDPTA